MSKICSYVFHVNGVLSITFRDSTLCLSFASPVTDNSTHITALAAADMGNKSVGDVICVMYNCTCDVHVL